MRRFGERLEDNSGDEREGMHVDGVDEGAAPGITAPVADPTTGVEEEMELEIRMSFLDELSLLSRAPAPPSSPRLTPTLLQAPVSPYDLEDDSISISSTNTDNVSGDNTPSSPSEIGLEDWMDERAAKLLPGGDSQVELHHIDCLLRTLVQVDLNAFTVVDHHDFVEVLSWVGSPPNGNLQVQRLRRDSTRETLIPFHYDGHIILAHIVKSRRFGYQVRLYGPDPKSLEVGWYLELDLALQHFMRGVFPEDVARWNAASETTLQEEIPLDPGLFIENLDASVAQAKPERFKHMVPIFFQALHIVSGVRVPAPLNFEMPPELPKRLFAVFAQNPATNLPLKTLRREGPERLKAELTRDLEEVTVTAAAKVRIAAVRGDPGDIVKTKWNARLQIQGGVLYARRVALGFAAAHHHLNTVAEALSDKAQRALVRLKYGVLEAWVGHVGLPNSTENAATLAVKALGACDTEQMVDLQARVGRLKEELALWGTEFHSVIGMQD